MSFRSTHPPVCLSPRLGCPSSYLGPDLDSFSDSTRTKQEAHNHLSEAPLSRISCVGNGVPNDSRSPRPVLLSLPLTGPAHVPALRDAAHLAPPGSPRGAAPSAEGRSLHAGPLPLLPGQKRRVPPGFPHPRACSFPSPASQSSGGEILKWKPDRFFKILWLFLIGLRIKFLRSPVVGRPIRGRPPVILHAISFVTFPHGIYST